MKHALTPWAGFLLASTAALAQPQIMFQDDTVTASGITPGGQAVFFGVSRELVDWFPKAERWRAIESDGDSDGTLVFAVGRGIPAVSLWAVVDLTTGASFVAGYPVSAFDGVKILATEEFPHSPGGKVEGVRVGGRRIELLVARPAVGAWFMAATDGEPFDADGVSDRAVTFAATQLSRLGDTPKALDELELGDVVVAIETTQLQVSLARIGQ